MVPENPGSQKNPEAPTGADWPDKTSSYRDKNRSYLLSPRRNVGFRHLFSLSLVSVSLSMK
jgi:hypothetical protein